MKLFKIIGLILVLSPLGQAFGAAAAAQQGSLPLSDSELFNTVVISAHGANLLEGFVLPDDVKVLTYAKCGEVLTTLVSTDIDWLMSISAMELAQPSVMGTKPHLYEPRHLLMDNQLHFNSDVVAAGLKVTGKKMLHGFKMAQEDIPGPLIAATADQNAIRWMRSVALEKRMGKSNYAELTRMCMESARDGSGIPLSRVMRFIYEATEASRDPVKNFVLHVCRGWTKPLHEVLGAIEGDVGCQHTRRIKDSLAAASAAATPLRDYSREEAEADLFARSSSIVTTQKTTGRLPWSRLSLDEINDEYVMKKTLK